MRERIKRPLESNKSIIQDRTGQDRIFAREREREITPFFLPKRRVICSSAHDIIKQNKTKQNKTNQIKQNKTKQIKSNQNKTRHTYQMYQTHTRRFKQ